MILLHHLLIYREYMFVAVFMASGLPLHKNGIEHTTLSKIELGRCRVEVMVVLEVAEALNQDVNVLLRQ